jgi:hypothetical protein
MSNKNKTVKELNAEFELLAERVKKLKEKDASEDSGKVQEKLNGIEEILKSYVKKLGDLNIEKEGSDSSDEEEIDPNQYGLGRMLQKSRQLEGKSHLREENDYQDQY